MKLESTGQKKLELGYENPPAGKYIWQIDENIDLLVSEDNDSNAQTLQIPLIIDSIIDGDAKEGQKASLFINVMKRDGNPNTFGEKQIVAILDMLGLIDKFSAKLGDEIEVTDVRFIQGLQMELPGKFLKMTHTVEKRKGMDKETVNFKTIESVARDATPKTATSEASGW